MVQFVEARRAKGDGIVNALHLTRAEWNSCRSLTKLATY